MLLFKNHDCCVSFYQNCLRYVKSKNYSKELMAEFPSWAVLHYSEKRNRIDSLFIDFLRHEFGVKKSERNLALTSEASPEMIQCTGDSESYYFVIECLESFEWADRRLLCRYFIEGYSLEEIASEQNLSKTRIKQKLDGLVKKLQNNAEISEG